MRKKNMKLKQSGNYRIGTIIITVVAVIVLYGANVFGDFRIGQVWNVDWPVCSSYDDSSPFISVDGLSLYFSSNRPTGSGAFDLWVSTRTSTIGMWSEPVNLRQTVNSSSTELHSSVTADALELYFDSDRSGGQGYSDLWVSKRSSTQDDWGTPENLGSSINSSMFDESPNISGDGLTLLWNSTRPRGFGGSDIWMSTRNSRDELWSEPVNLGSVINSSHQESNAVLSSDSLAIFFGASDRPGGYGDFDIWFSKRNSVKDNWGTPINLGPSVNTEFSEFCPNISVSGTTLYFSDWPRQRPGGYGAEDIWQVSMNPVVDFNNDGDIDTDDMLLLMNHWNTNNPISIYDIGPMPWGDGVVDMKDLEVFIRYWEMENFIDVDEHDNGSQVTLKQGQRLVVTLDSNPTTGFNWELIEKQNSILEQIGEAEYKPSVQDDNIAGAGGWEIFLFRAATAGLETLELIYRRPWETDVEPAKTFSIEVTVN